MTAAIARSTPKKSVRRKQQKPYRRQHVIIPIEDMLWASKQKPSVNQLWQECWTSDPYGSRWMPLNTTLGYSTFLAAKKVLSATGLFIFKPDKSIKDGRETIGWIVRNLHGSRVKSFWEQEVGSIDEETHADLEEMHALDEECILDESKSAQTLEEVSETPHQHLTNSSKEFVRCNGDRVDSASLGGDMPPNDEENNKWSSEARAVRLKTRPARMEKLKFAQILGENPGFEYLKECWDDDPLLQIVIKKMLTKFPQWGFVILGEELINNP
ncbi:MAG: hypothetical protein V7K47_06815 [Nostoc sp.]